ncbi:hypothetical protein EAG_11063 [Camponotus floridanus]|uniref:Uncharacterized protein n=1 Tax=Camponotus floridanus TaxID=104421 RepID=E2AAX9_CAMFO|nr:hypothetical protein EAG_11063 [Camponotus floridanus]
MGNLTENTSSRWHGPRPRPLLGLDSGDKHKEFCTKRQRKMRLLSSSYRTRVIPGSCGLGSIAASMIAWWGAQPRGQSARDTREILAPRAKLI